MSVRPRARPALLPPGRGKAGTGVQKLSGGATLAPGYRMPQEPSKTSRPRGR
jgi:hypothetical protein